MANAAAGAQLVALAKQHIGEKYVLGVLVPKNNPNWHGPWDCAEFASWVVYQATGSLYGCANDTGDPSSADAFSGYWERDSQSLGRTISIMEAAQTPGAVVLRFPAAGATGHVVLSDGNGGTVEAHSSKDGVVALALANRRWDGAVLIPWVDYTQNPPVPVAPPATPIYRLTTPPMSGPAVLEIQNALNALGFDPGIADDVFGPHTQAAVVAFQLSNGLTPDGEVGTQTAAALGISL
ncbi:MAG: peptidoglycan-binding domain-containing protein [Terracidiphilus sp.]